MYLSDKSVSKDPNKACSGIRRTGREEKKIRVILCNRRLFSTAGIINIHL